MKKHKIIINADDLGMSDEVNSSIEKAIQEGCISSSTIMVNAPAFEDAIRIAKQYPQISFGLHLNIDEFRPLTDPSIFKKYGMITESGTFKKEYLHNIDIDYCEELVEAIYNEWKAQIEKLLGAGIIPSHLDSHEHTHGIFNLQPAFVRLMKEYGIRKARRQPYSSMLEMVVMRLIHQRAQAKQGGGHCENIQAPKRHSFMYRRVQQILDAYRHRQWIHKMREETFAVTDYFYSYQMFLKSYPMFLKYRKMCTIELMTHPGHNGYLAETDMLMRKELQSICQYELINYYQL